MPQIINTNLASLNAQRNLNTSQSANQEALSRLSSGLRINSAKDDAAGMAISTRFTAQIRGLNVAIRNVGDGVSLAQTADGALGTITDNLQRVRELAVQSANATNSDVDREALQAEVSQLIAEIKRTGEQTAFNGLKLFDGSYDATFQIGANVGETVSFGISELSDTTLGGGKSAGVSATGDISALDNGDLVINGVVVGASIAASDNASTANAASSAIAKAAAINAVSDQSGVEATVLTNTASGTSQQAATGGAAATTGTIVLNGVTISMATGDVDQASDRSAVVTAINARSAETGVVAVDSGSAQGGVTLEAADGRNIDLSFATGTLTAASTALTSTAVTTGGYTLTSKDGSSPVVISAGTGDLSNAGLVEGAFSAKTAAVNSASRATADGLAPLDALAEGDLKINGITIGSSQASADTASNDTADSSDKAASGIAIAASINASAEETGVSAAVNATVVNGSQTTAGTAGENGIIYINGVAASEIVLSGDAESDRTTAINAINDISGQTGVVAEDAGGYLKLTAADGRNIAVAIDNVGSTFTGENIGLDAAVDGIGEGYISGALPVDTYADTAETTASTVTLTSAKEFSVEAGTNGTAGLAALGLSAGTFGGSEGGQFLSELDIGTVEGAESAILAVDNALATVSSQRAGLGAIQNRLESTVSNLTVTAENLTAANSRILDADFAVETANLSKSQVLQQAGISILAQANASTQQVLSLLQ